MAKKLSPREKDQAYNACVRMRNEARGELFAALEDFNRATNAAEALYRLRLPTYRLVERAMRDD